MDLRLEDKRALVTGSSAGIGAEIARALAAEGARVVVHGRDAGRAEATADRIRADGGRVALVLGDLTEAAAFPNLSMAAIEAFGGIDILVNNAGIYVPRGWFEVEPEDWVATYQSNVASMVRTIHAFAPGMRERGWGRIVNIASGVATAPFPSMPDYAASKAAVLNLTVSLSKELGGTGVTANAVAVGITRTEEVERFFRTVAAEQGWGDDWAEIERRVLSEWASVPVGRIAIPEEVASLVVFLASPNSGFITGSNLRVDGGIVGTVN